MIRNIFSRLFSLSSSETPASLSSDTAAAVLEHTEGTPAPVRTAQAQPEPLDPALEETRLLRTALDRAEDDAEWRQFLASRAQARAAQNTLPTQSTPAQDEMEAMRERHLAMLTPGEVQVKRGPGRQRPADPNSARQKRLRARKEAESAYRERQAARAAADRAAWAKSPNNPRNHPPMDPPAMITNRRR